MSVALSCSLPADEASAFDEARLRSRAQAVLDALGHGDSELSLAIVGDAEMMGLNEAHRGLPEPTDVLSFSLLEGEYAAQRGGLLGDVVIALPVAARQARELGHDLDGELLRLLVHGVLHLLGHDHEEPDDARRMQAEERRLLESLR